MKRNEHFSKLVAGYLFPEIEKRKRAFLEKNPTAKIISLGIGNTTEPLTPHIGASLSQAAQDLMTRQGYRGYGAEQGMDDLRQAIARRFYHNLVSPQDVFISDGAKCDVGRLQFLFGADAQLAVQDPVYPVYVDSGVMIGQSDGFEAGTGRFEGFRYLDCLPTNNFFPNLEKAIGADVLFFCSPNNPTGAVATRAQLEELVHFARKHKMIIVFDAAYSLYIRDPELPKSIYEIEGAKEVAIEVHSFSKSAGFTGVRLGWTVVPEQLCYDDGFPVRSDWNRIMTTLFNGASNIVQRGGMACLSEEGWAEMHALVDHYMGNAALIRACLDRVGVKYYGGVNAPYVWVQVPGKNSWEVFDALLDSAQIVCTPGVGFGAAGEGFVRLSAFGQREQIEEACHRLQETLPLLLQSDQ
jgi:LL-diaminopimelate aminotransferase